jgi:hypothetical protein
VGLTAPRAAHQREGHERFTLDAILREEAAVLDLVDARNDRALLWIIDEDTALLSADQTRAVENIGRSPWLAQPLSAPAGAGKTTSMRALRAAARRRFGGTVLVFGADRQGRRRRGPRGRRRPGLHHRQSLVIVARQPARAETANSGDR